MKLTQKRLKQILRYIPSTGKFVRRVHVSSNGTLGQEAGTITPAGYVRVQIDGHLYMAHQLAWLYVYGKFPEEEIDHVDGKRANNRIKNLRQCSSHQNKQNLKKPYKNSASGYLGVFFDRRTNKWAAQIGDNGKRYWLGRFNCPTAAYFLGYLPAKRKRHPFGTL